MQVNTTHLVVAAVMLGTSAGASIAQDALVVGDTYVSASRDPGQRLGAAPIELHYALAGGGRYAVGPTEAIDLRTRQSRPLPAGAVVLAVDPVRPRAFLALNCDNTADTCDVVAWHIISGDAVPLTTMAYTQAGGFFVVSHPLLRYAVDADVLFVDRASIRPIGPVGTRLILPVNASTGVVLRPAIRTRLASWDVLPDASRIIVGATLFPGIDEPPASDVIDVATERVVAHADIRLERVTWEAAVQAVVGVQWSTGSVAAFDLNLRPLGMARIDGGCSLAWQVSPHTGRVYILSGGGRNSWGEYSTHLIAVDPERGAIDVDLSRKAGLPVGGCYPMRVLTAPGPPRVFRAAAMGHEVSLAWENLGAASHFVLDVGFVPGRTDASVFLGPDSHATFGNVPPGTYYLRLRGGNEFGGGRASNEIRVVVP